MFIFCFVVGITGCSIKFKNANLSSGRGKTVTGEGHRRHQSSLFRMQNIKSLVSLSEVILSRHVEAAHAVAVQQKLNQFSLAGRTPLSAKSLTAKVAVVVPRRSVS